MPYYILPVVTDLTIRVEITLALTGCPIEPPGTVQGGKVVALAAALQVLLQHHLPQLGVRHVLGPRQVGGDHHLQLLLADPGDGDGEKNKSTGGEGKECIRIRIVAESRNCEKLWPR